MVKSTAALSFLSRLGGGGCCGCGSRSSSSSCCCASSIESACALHLVDEEPKSVGDGAGIAG